ncbi:hypothetical protein [Mycobacterium sp. AZCC_0083]|uniref:hypothetical protein n=1 Tax=Mycobacterium sp. AZCC_0083 TaxID=2735882 RepID=UPI00161859A0|nr:hypothetical protein [Mycobacterium sp. AZCC_0083]MBB5166440.1 hypothetical protein [Mycobacterium sp. AZCC_0083]
MSSGRSHGSRGNDATGDGARRCIDDDSPHGAAALSRALVWVTERAFYEAVKSESPLDHVAETVIHLWWATLPE